MDAVEVEVIKVTKEIITEQSNKGVDSIKLRKLLYPNLEWETTNNNRHVDLTQCPIPSMAQCLSLKSKLPKVEVQQPTVKYVLPNSESVSINRRESLPQRLAFHGQVLKLGSTQWVKTWKKRFFVVCERGFTFLKKMEMIESVLKGTEPPNGWSPIRLIEKVEPVPKTVSKKLNSFMLHLKGKKPIYISSESIGSNDWTKNIATIALLVELQDANVTKERIRDLCEMNADIDFETEKIGPPICLAIQNGHREIAMYLLRRGCNQAPTLRWKFLKQTKATTASFILNLLVDTSCDLNIRGDDEYQWTLLHYLVLDHDMESMKSLVARVDAPTISAPDARGDSSLMLGLKLFPASTTGFDAVSLCMMIAEGVDPNAKDRDGNPLLHLAVIQGHETLARHLVKAGALTAPLDVHGNNAYHLAMKCKMYAFVKWLVENDRTVEVTILRKDEQLGDTLLTIAVKQNNEEMALFAWEHGENSCSKPKLWGIPDHDDDSLLLIAIQYGFKKLATKIVEHCEPSELQKTGNLKVPVMVLAIEQHMFELVDLMLSRHSSHISASLCNQISESDGCNAIQKALNLGLFLLVGRMLKLGGDVNNQDRRGYTLMHDCVTLMHDSRDVEPRVKLFLAVIVGLLKLDADCRLVEKSRHYTPLHLAVSHKMPTAVSLILDSHLCDKDQREYKGNPSLNIAIFERSVDIVRILLDHQVSVDIVNSNQLTALHIAVHQKACGILRLLLEKGGAYPGCWDSQGRCPLHVAAISNDAESVSMFVQYCNLPGNLDLRTEDGYTAAMLAVKNVCFDSLKELINGGVDVDTKVPVTHETLLHCGASMVEDPRFIGSGIPELLLGMGQETGDWIVDNNGMSAKQAAKILSDASGYKLVVGAKPKQPLQTNSNVFRSSVITQAKPSDSDRDSLEFGSCTSPRAVPLPEVKFEELSTQQRVMVIEMTKKEAWRVAESWLCTHSGARMLDKLAGSMMATSNSIKSFDEARELARSQFIEQHLAEWISLLPSLL